MSPESQIVKDCLHPDDAATILAVYRSGNEEEALLHLKAHLKECKACSGKMHEVNYIESLFSRENARRDHLEFLRVVDRIESRKRLENVSLFSVYCDFMENTRSENLQNEAAEHAAEELALAQEFFDFLDVQVVSSVPKNPRIRARVGWFAVSMAAIVFLSFQFFTGFPFSVSRESNDLAQVNQLFDQQAVYTPREQAVSSGNFSAGMDFDLPVDRELRKIFQVDFSLPSSGGSTSSSSNSSFFHLTMEK
ncbi:MAG TPA: hypothetical protein PLF96_05175 [Thermotogota bacterium]|nr:hypothetical protein [Thermotogota bacterium]